MSGDLFSRYDALVRDAGLTAEQSDALRVLIGDAQASEAEGVRRAGAHSLVMFLADAGLVLTHATVSGRLAYDPANSSDRAALLRGYESRDPHGPHAGARTSAARDFVEWLGETRRTVSGEGTMQVEYHPSLADEAEALLRAFEESRP